MRVMPVVADAGITKELAIGNSVAEPVSKTSSPVSLKSPSLFKSIKILHHSLRSCPLKSPGYIYFYGCISAN